MKVLLCKVFLLAAFFTSCQAMPSGNTITAASPALADVKAAINTAKDGDTVMIPAGTATWTGGITMPTDRTLKVLGAGIGKTIINRSPRGAIFSIGVRGHSIGGFSTSQGTFVASGSQGFRIHNVEMSYTEFTDCITSYMEVSRPTNWAWGVIDNCEILNGRIVCHGTNYMLSENNAQHYLWALDAPLGTQYAVYVEDCHLKFDVFGPIVDGNYGGRYVFRHNYVEHSYLEVHGVGGNMRAMRTWEIYNNIFQGGGLYSGGNWTPMFIRGGTGVIFNNTLRNYNASMMFNNRRDTESYSVCGQCNGSSNWDQNTPGEAGWACRDQVGRGKDLTLWSSGQPFNQAIDPVYVWGNVDHNGNTRVPSVHNPSSPSHILENRDYFNSPKPGYTPYTYPHPLRKNQ